MSNPYFVVLVLLLVIYRILFEVYIEQLLGGYKR